MSELDIFENQIEKAKKFFKQQGIDAKLNLLAYEERMWLA